MGLLEIKDISMDFKLEGQTLKAVENANLSVEKGQFISIVGHSGSGKTTLLSIIGGVLSPTSGKVIFDGIDIYALGDDKLSEYRASDVGYIFQFASLMPVLTVMENLLLPTIFDPGSDDESSLKSRALEYLDLMGLADKAGALPAQLSGGQQRRVAIARSLMNEPSVLLADEPTGDLDEETEAEVISFLRKANEDKGVSVILVTHNNDLARATTRQIRMDHGKVVEL